MSGTPLVTGRYLTTAMVAERLYVTTTTLERWRKTGYGPRFLQSGKRVLYAESALAEWEAEHTVSPRPLPQPGEIAA